MLPERVEGLLVLPLLVLPDEEPNVLLPLLKLLPELLPVRNGLFDALLDGVLEVLPEELPLLNGRILLRASEAPLPKVDSSSSSSSSSRST